MALRRRCNGAKHSTEATGLRSEKWEVRSEKVVRGEETEMGDKIKSFEDLIVYQKAYNLALQAHKLANTFPENEKRELGYQIRRAAVSIPANIAEGYGRKNSAKEFKHFLRNALGSSNELIVLLKLSRDLGYTATSNIIEDYDILGKQLFTLIEKWE